MDAYAYAYVAALTTANGGGGSVQDWLEMTRGARDGCESQIGTHVGLFIS